MQCPLSNQCVFQQRLEVGTVAVSGSPEQLDVNRRTRGGAGGRVTWEKAAFSADSRHKGGAHSLSAVSFSQPCRRQRTFRCPPRFAVSGGANHRALDDGSHNEREEVLNARESTEGPGHPPAPEKLTELPLLPINSVLFPGAVLPLQIFEYRFRIMFNTIVDSDQKFGVIYAGPRGELETSIGCCGEVFEHDRLPDDRFNIVCRGVDRFRVVSVVRHKPYIVARVAWVHDTPPSAVVAPRVDSLASEVEQLMREVMRLSFKYNGKDRAAPVHIRRNAPPTQFSYYVAASFKGAEAEQQALLEMTSTYDRLVRERETLRNTLNYLTAASAVKDVFSHSDNAASDNP
eukprot:jgi/Mesvir1/1206/Mv17694-RA.1